MSVIRKTVTLSVENVKAFEKHYPESNLSWALDLLLEKLVAQFDRTAEEYAEAAVQDLKEELET
jgi:hypothetical protein